MQKNITRQAMVMGLAIISTVLGVAAPSAYAAAQNTVVADYTSSPVCDVSKVQLTAYECYKEHVQIVQTGTYDFYATASVSPTGGYGTNDPSFSKVSVLRSQVDLLNLGSPSGVLAKAGPVNGTPDATATTSTIHYTDPTLLQARLYYSVRFQNGNLDKSNTSLVHYGD